MLLYNVFVLCFSRSILTMVVWYIFVQYLLSSNADLLDCCFQLRESKGMTTIKFRPHSGEVFIKDIVST